MSRPSYEVSRRAAPRLFPLYKSVNIVSLNLAGQTQSPISPCKPGSQHRPAAASPASIGRRHLCKPECKPGKARGRETRMQTPPSLVGVACSVCPLFLSSAPRLSFPLFLSLLEVGLLYCTGYTTGRRNFWCCFVCSVFIHLEEEYEKRGRNRKIYQQDSSYSIHKKNH